MKTKPFALFAALSLSASAVAVHAQDDDGPPPPKPASATPSVAGGSQDNNGGSKRSRMSPEDFRQRMTERLKASLKASDEEWTVIQPLLEKVFNKQREASSRSFGGRRSSRSGGGEGGASNGGPGGPSGIFGTSSPEAQALSDALEKDDTASSDIQAKLTALREQRKKAAGELAQAREDLKKVLTPRQEATLVMMGLLE